MKKLLFIIIPLIVYSCGQMSDKSLSEEQIRQIKEEIKATASLLFEYTYKVNFEKSLEFYDSTDFTQIMNGQLLDYKTFKEGNKQFWSGLEYQKISAAKEMITVLSKEYVLYTVLGVDEAKFKNGDILKADPLAITLLFKNVNGTWKICYYHGSAVFESIPAQFENIMYKN